MWNVVNSVSTFAIDAVAGNIEGVTVINKFGKNAAVASTIETVWDQGGMYTTPASDNVSLSISTDDNANTHEMTVIGLDASFVEQTKTVTLAGETKTAIDGTWARVFRAYNSSATSSAASSVIYIYDTATATVTAGVPQTATKIHAVVQAAEEQTLMAVYTIPANKTGYMCSVYGMSTTPAAAEFEIHISARESGGVYRTLHDAHITQVPQHQYTFALPLKLAAKTDIEVRAACSTGSRVVSAGFTIINIPT